MNKHQYAEYLKNEIRKYCAFDVDLGLNTKAYKTILERVKHWYSLFPTLLSRYFHGFYSSKYYYWRIGMYVDIDYDQVKLYDNDKFVRIKIYKHPRKSELFSETVRMKLYRNQLKRGERIYTFSRSFGDDIDHEFVHVLHAICNVNDKFIHDNERIALLWEKVRFEVSGFGEEEMSSYSKVDICEFIAECFISGIHKSSKIGIEVYDILMNTFTQLEQEHQALH